MSDWRNSREYRLWRVAVIRRDKVCKICGDRKFRQAHHMNHATYFPEERFNPENGVTLCRKCHSHFHNDYKNSTREKCTKEDYSEYNKLAKYFSEKSMFFMMKKLKENNELCLKDLSLTLEEYIKKNSK